MTSRTRRRAMLVVGLWALLLCPGLCLAGLLEHLCVDCDEHAELASAHEETCTDDPCSEVAVRPDDDSLASGPDLAAIEAPIVAIHRLEAHEPVLAAPLAVPDPPGSRVRARR